MNKQQKQVIHPNQQVLYEAIESDIEHLYRTVQIYLKRAIKELGSELGRSVKYPVETIAQEIISQTLETVLTKAEDFNPELPPRPWILKFAAYEVKGWKRDQKRKHRRVINITDLPQARQQLDAGKLSEEEILGLLIPSANSSNSESQMMVEYLLSLVEGNDREILKLAFVDELDGKSLAGVLGIREGTVYQRKRRAIERLRQAYIQATQEQVEGK
ncbi:MAG: RNA polymerase sigma factor [Halothece sp.]